MRKKEKFQREHEEVIRFSAQHVLCMQAQEQHKLHDLAVSNSLASIQLLIRIVFAYVINRYWETFDSDLFSTDDQVSGEV